MLWEGILILQMQHLAYQIIDKYKKLLIQLGDTQDLIWIMSSGGRLLLKKLKKSWEKTRNHLITEEVDIKVSNFPWNKYLKAQAECKFNQNIHKNGVMLVIQNGWYLSNQKWIKIRRRWLHFLEGKKRRVKHMMIVAVMVNKLRKKKNQSAKWIFLIWELIQNSQIYLEKFPHQLHNLV